MARKVLLETGYTFTPATRTIVIPRSFPQERLILITNVTKNKVIFNFSDPSMLATSFVNGVDSNGSDIATVVLNYNTTTMSSTDKLQIVVDEYAEAFTPAETQLDPANKLRVSLPQALIDTDFEYGTQVSKWENLGMIDNRPFASISPAPIGVVYDIQMATSGRIVTVYLTSGSAIPTVGTPVVVQDTYLSIANGNFIVESTGAGSGSFTGYNYFTYTGRAVNITSINSVFDTNKTAIYQGTLYTNAAIGSAPTSVTYSGNVVTVTTSVPHGLSLGNEIAVTGITTTGANPPNGSFTVNTIPNGTSFSYYAQSTPSGTLTYSSAAVYMRPQAQFLHRAFDGGVLFSTNANSNFESAVRQTRRYFRYQSGKGIQMSSGTILKPYASIDALSSSGTVVTVQTREKHNIQPGISISVYGANESAYNGTFTVQSVSSYNTFTYNALTTPSSTQASGNYNLSVNNWNGATTRLGIFDQQNGLFFEWDGQVLYAVRRNSTYQLSGKATVTNGSNTVTQTNAAYPTAFSKQANVGDYIVLRGQSYRITDIASDTSLTISPSYRGASANYVIVSKTQDLKIPQSQWNIDKMDGTGPSGISVDLSKMQMFYIDFTWYGAGFIRWGLRGAKGNVTYVHKMPNNNVNNEAYMRSGNLPARYETITQPPATYITSSVATTDSAIVVASTTGFPSAGTICIRNASTYEFVNYTGLTSTTFTGLTRGQAGQSSLTLSINSGSNIATVGSTTGLQVGQRLNGSAIPDGTWIQTISGTTITLNQAVTAANPTVQVMPMGVSSAQAFTYSATAPNAVELAFPSFGPSISHWGTSVIMDGRYDDDKSLLFTYGQNAPTTIAPINNSTTATGSASASTTITITAANAAIFPGMLVTGSGVPANTYVVTYPGTGTAVVVNQAVTLSSVALTFAGAQKALFSIRVAPSVDNGIPAVFGARELTNRMQLILRALDITTSSSPANILVTAVLNGTVTTQTAWTNAVGNVVGRANSSLAQIADYAPTVTGSVTGITGGENTGGFFTNSTTSIDLSNVRDLGNAILGGGTSIYSNATIYPDGPDVLTIMVTNVGTAAVNVLGRLSWSEAQA
jgi:hypothetical protein